ncbi:MAG: 30S ribosomal protein S2 [Patescibacteria group bacterium]
METNSNILATEDEPRPEGQESDIEKMASHGVHLGALRAHSHPKMKPNVWSNKSIFQIIDLEKSKKGLKSALDFLVGVRKKGGVILFVGTGFAAKEITQKVAEALGMPYVTERWLGGTFTNFTTISRRIEYLRTLESQKAAGEFEKYTKYEALKLQEKIQKLRKDLGGLINMTRLPDAMWASSANYDKIAVREAFQKNVPVAGLVNTNADPSVFNYPIPAGDSSVDSVGFILNLVKETLIDVKVVVPAEAEVAPKESER